MVKIILKENVPNLGEAGEVVKVADGYARNYLIPRGIAEEATPKSMARADEYRRKQEDMEDSIRREAEEIAEQIKKTKMEIAMKSGEKGKLFGSVTSGDIADFLNSQGYTVDKKKVELEENIKTLGTHIVPIKLHPEVIVELEVIVEEEKEE